MENKKALLLVGSPHVNNGSSKAIGQYLLEKFKLSGYTDQIIYIYNALKSKDSINELISSFNDSDLIIFSYPLYVDSLPANCIQALEIITEARASLNVNKEQKFFAIGNCGFYEKHQLNNSINVLEFFANENNLLWQGGLAVGGGGQIGGKNLKTLGGMTFGLRKALDKIADSILTNVKPPQNLIDKKTFPPEPRFAYLMLSNWSFKQFLKKKYTPYIPNDVKHL